MRKDALRIYMCDLTHDSVVLVSDTIPINIGFIGAFAKKIYGDDIEISLFKYPRTIIEAIEKRPPDVVALSNYSWNSKLSERIASLAKQRNSNVVTVQGGTNFPHKVPQQLEFLLSRPATDVYVELEAERSFSELIGYILSARDSGRFRFKGPIAGCVYIEPSTRDTKNPVLIRGELPPRLKDLDEIPSPYLSGMLDHFFDGRLTPFLETNRGCPFQCTFCHTGADYFQKINMFSLERVREEIGYIAPRASSFGIVNLHVADTNFGMYQRDKSICEALLETQKQYGWPRQIMATTGKNNKERVIAITDIMGSVFSVNMSVQSMDSDVLTNIKRDNISLDAYKKINEHLNQQGRATKGEVIIGLPGESRESFVRGVEQMIGAGVSSVCSYTLMLLHGTEFKDPNYREQFKIQGKFRMVPLNFGVYAGEKVFDTEEAGVATSTMSFEDYLWIRGLSLFVETMHNNRPYDELIRFGKDLGLTRFQFIKRAYDSLETAPPSIRQVVSEFMQETRSELWDSEQELEAFYREDQNYEKLLAGKAGGNLIYKYKAMSLAFCNSDWADYLGGLLHQIVQESQSAGRPASGMSEQIHLLVQFVKNKLKGVLNVEGDLRTHFLESPFDVVGWLRNKDGSSLFKFKTDTPVVYIFEYTDEQLLARKDYFRRYGTDANALSKIVTRVSNVESLFRRIRVESGNETDSTHGEIDKDLFIRYTLSN